MYIKKIKYEDYDGNPREKRFYFNLSKAELLEMELSTNGGYENYINRIIESKDQAELVRIFKDLILKSYGVRSDDGERFVKSKELTDAFTQTDAYSELFMELATNAEAATAFVNGIIPPVLAAKVKEEMKNNPVLPE